MEHKRIISAIQAELWAITPEALNQIISIAKGFGDAEAVAAKLGKPLTNTSAVTVRDGVAVVPVIGPIFRYANLFTEISGATSIATLALDFQKAVDDPSIKSIVLEMDSPGGQANGISEFAAQIRAATAVKPVVAYVSNMSASAGYWLASAASEIIVSDTALLGSIGVVLQPSSDDDGNIKFISSQSPLKHADPSTDAGKAQYQQIVDSLAQVFIETSAEYRGVTPEEVMSNFGGGGVLIASAAIAAGMADRIGSLESVIAELSGTKPKNLPKKGTTMTMTKESIAADYPDIAAALTKDGFDAGMSAGIAQGAQAERDRIHGIEALAMPGHDELIAKLKYDGKTTAAEAAIQILAAEKNTRANMGKKFENDTPKPVPHAAAPEHEHKAESDGLQGKEKWQADWKESADLQAEFKTADVYCAYMQAVENGSVKILGGK